MHRVDVVVVTISPSGRLHRQARGMEHRLPCQRRITAELAHLLRAQSVPVLIKQ